MFDIDGTLVESYDFDSTCFAEAIKDVLGITINSDWARYQHVTDSGILNQIIDELFLDHSRKEIELSVKANFLVRIKKHVSRNTILPVDGAAEFLSELGRRKDVALAFATGSWLESARVKLDAAGIYLPDIPIASASDHSSRVEIMKCAQNKTGCSQYKSITYFGDGPWDLRASLDLGYNFVLVGNRIDYHQSINNFRNIDLALNYIGL
jgi:beta-phosphoglucomutase-like phosphatase (HAD superfamily)